MPTRCDAVIGTNSNLGAIVPLVSFDKHCTISSFLKTPFSTTKITAISSEDPSQRYY